MEFLEGLRRPELARPLVERLSRYQGPPANLMEVCGTHTVSIFRNGLRDLMPANVRLLSGPGCPVCVTPNGAIDRAIAMARKPGVTLVTFGDMMKVPGSRESLAEAKAVGADVRIVYGPLESVRLAQSLPDRTIVFFGVGFETTVPATAACVDEAAKLGLTNYLFYSVHKLVPPAMKALLAARDVRIDGFICPGHVSAIIGTRPYEFIPRDHGIGCAIAGFEAVDILQAIVDLLEMHTTGRAQVMNDYRRVVREEGNPRALELIDRIFETTDSAWRGIGSIPGTGLALRPEWDRFRAETRLPVKIPPPKEPLGCRCGDVLRGAMSPPECPLFGGRCVPEHPVGPCMVSTEGSCAAWYHYSPKARKGARTARPGRSDHEHRAG